jgi:hypothetical protein
MLQLLLVAGDVKFAPPRILCATADSGLHASYVEHLCPAILTMCFSQVPADLAKPLSPLTTHQSMQHISKNLALALLSAKVQHTPLDCLKFETTLITILSFVGQDNIAKIKAHRDKRKFDFVKVHCKLLNTTVKGLGVISRMECIIKICTNVCCVVTAFFDINRSNPVSLLYSMCIKMINFVKHLDFIQWCAIVCTGILQLHFIFLIMLQQGLFQLAIYSTNAVNIGLVKCRDNGANLNIV